MERRHWTFTLEDGSQVTFYEDAIALIHWSKEAPGQLAGARVVLQCGQIIDLLKVNAKMFYQMIVHPMDDQPQKK